MIKVRGTQNIVKPIEVNIDTVYIRDSVVKIETEEFKGWEYNEKQYGLKQYLEIMANTKDELQDESLINMFAMAEMYEKNVSLGKENINNMLAITELFELLGGM